MEGIDTRPSCGNKFLDDVFHAFDQPGAFLQQAIAAPGLAGQADCPETANT